MRRAHLVVAQRPDGALFLADGCKGSYCGGENMWVLSVAKMMEKAIKARFHL
jgi:hypothetical protein